METLNEASTVQLIDEQVHHCTLELVEGQGDKAGRVFARGEFGHAANPTANGRLYRHNIWESNIERLRPNLEARKVLGELDHPSDGRTALQRASHVITGLGLDGDRVMGEAEILDTAKGRDLKAILKAGVPVGISSRGYGSTAPNKEGVEEVKEDYKLVTFDFVAEPADPTAYPDVVFESSEQGAAMMFEGVGLEDSTEVASVSNEEERKPTDAPAEESAEAAQQDVEEDDNAPVPESSTEDEGEVAAAIGKVLKDSEGKEVSVEELRREFSKEIVHRIGSMRKSVESQVREQFLSDPKVAGALNALEDVRKVLLPYVLTDDAKAAISEKEVEIAALRDQLKAAEEHIEAQESMIERLASAAKEAGYKYHLECLLREDDSDKDRIRSIVGDVLQYESPDALQESIEAAREEMNAFRIEEEQVVREREARERQLQEKNVELAEGLEKALTENKKLALQVYASERLQVHPQGAKILRMLTRSGFQSKEHIDAVIEDFREPVRSVDDLESVRARVRNKLHGGREYLAEESQPGPKSNNGAGSYNGLGASLAELKMLSGMRD